LQPDDVSHLGDYLIGCRAFFCFQTSLLNMKAVRSEKPCRPLAPQ
jgi:hypothetical protein